MDRLLTRSQAADQLQVSTSTVDKMRSSGTLPTVFVTPDAPRIPASAVAEIISQTAARAATSGGDK